LAPEVSVRTLARLLDTDEASLRDATSDREALLTKARSEGHKLAATLLSLLDLAGDPLSAEQRAELSVLRERSTFYGEVWKTLHALAPDAFILKGPVIGALYPAGVLRSASDLDVVCPTEAGLWACATHLQDQGWEVEALTVWRARTGDDLAHHVLAELMRPGPADDADTPYAVGLVTAEIVTDTHGPAVQLARPTPTPAASAVALLAERWERPFRSRDLLDLALLLAELDATGLAALRDGLTRAALWPAWREALREIHRLGLPLPAGLPEAGATARRVALARRARRIGAWIHPVRLPALIAQAGTDREDSHLVLDAASEVVHRWIGVHRVLAARLPAFAVPLGGPQADVSRLRLVRAGRRLVARTPVGDFLLAGGAVREEWLDGLDKLDEFDHEPVGGV
jgi:hypothetical protein